MKFLQFTFGLTLIFAASIASSNDLGLSKSQLNSLLGLSPTATPKTANNESKKAAKTTIPAKSSKAKKTVKAKKKIIMTETKLPLANTSNFDCGKKYCKRMTSCAEARYKLEQCGHSRLDRDNDGIPCENVCL